MTKKEYTVVWAEVTTYETKVVAESQNEALVLAASVGQETAEPIASHQHSDMEVIDWAPVPADRREVNDDERQ